MQDLWFSRASRVAGQYPEARIGAREGPLRVPCAMTGLDGLPVDIFAIHVQGIGNCLYHAVWTAAELAGVRRPFGVTASRHVFDLRVKVGIEVVRLLEQGKLHSVFGHEPLHVGELIARPNQYLEYSGVVPLSAMASMLKRRIVTLCADGVFVVTPELGSLSGEQITENPVVIYHCAAGRVGDYVSLDARNHYVAVFFPDNAESRRFKEVVCRRDGIHPGPILVEKDTVKPCRAKRLSGVLQDVSNELPNKRLKCVRPERSCAAIRQGSAELPNEKPEYVQQKSFDDGSSKMLPLELLVSKATSVTNLTDEELVLLRHNFTKHPRLALLCFHCCSADPTACVFGDEKVDGAGSGDTLRRLLNNLDKPTSAETAKACQDRVRRSSGSSGDLWACASCCEFLNTVEDRVQFVEFAKLDHGFKLTPSEVDEINKIPWWVVEHHLQVYRSGRQLYHLNPDLVNDLNAIPLCSKCACDPRKSAFSIASGHDYGRPGSLPELGEVASKCIAPVRAFKLEITVSGKHAIGHVICFPSDGPVKCSKIIPCTSKKYIPRVTFVGPRKDWKVRKNFTRIHSSCLSVICIYGCVCLLVRMNTSEKTIFKLTSRNRKGSR